MLPCVTYVFNSTYSAFQEQLITRVDVVFSVLPSSIFERYLIYVLKESDICAPWKSGFFAKKGKSMVLCKVTYGKNNSSVEFHSRFLKGYVTDVWLTVLQFWKVNIENFLTTISVRQKEVRSIPSGYNNSNSVGFIFVLQGRIQHP